MAADVKKLKLKIRSKLQLVNQGTLTDILLDILELVELEKQEILEKQKKSPGKKLK